MMIRGRRPFTGRISLQGSSTLYQQQHDRTHSIAYSEAIPRFKIVLVVHHPSSRYSIIEIHPSGPSPSKPLSCCVPMLHISFFNEVGHGSSASSSSHKAFKLRPHLVPGYVAIIKRVSHGTEQTTLRATSPCLRSRKATLHENRASGFIGLRCDSDIGDLHRHSPQEEKNSEQAGIHFQLRHTIIKLDFCPIHLRATMALQPNFASPFTSYNKLLCSICCEKEPDDKTGSMGNPELNIQHMLKILDDMANFKENATIIYTFPYSDLLATHRQFEINNIEHEQLLKNNRL
ncbi:hypothetical protein D5086_026125 [Populus alba]|uniref:Uncharacterized protein n=1 Tax=Populus alba TaxID=43335 RepID=A0ACC4B1K9_POPAL